MSNSFISLRGVMQAGITSDGAQPSPEFLKKLQEWENKLQNTISLVGELQGQIASSAKIAGRTEGIGTTVSKLTNSGQLDSLLNVANDRNLANIDDASLRKAVTVEQSNYIAVAAVQVSGQTGLSRPTTYTATGQVYNPQLAYDASDGTTGAEIVGSQFIRGIISQQNGDLIVNGFTKPTGPISSATLFIISDFNGAEEISTGVLRYTLNGGISWTDLFRQTTSRAKTTDTINLLASQDFSLIKVEATVTATNGPISDGAFITLFDNFINFTLA